MNAKTPDQLDDRIRTMMRTVDEHTETPPTIDDIIGGVRRVTVRREPDAGGRRWWVAVAAALMLVFAGGVGWWVLDTRRPPVTPADHPTGGSRLGLGAYALPGALPAGWALVDISEMAADNVGAISPRLWTLSRADTGQRAVLAVYPPASDSTDVTVDRATETTASATSTTGSGPVWQHDLYTDTGELRWTTNGVEVFLSAKDETSARALYADLTPSTGSAPLTYTLSTQSPYVFEQSLGEVVPSASGSANLTYIDGVGNTVQISLYQSNGRSLPTLLDPGIVDAPAAVRSGDNAGETFGYRVLDGRLESYSYSNQRGAQPVDTVALEALLNSLALVDAQQWDDQITAIADRIEAQPVTGSGSVVGGELRVHRGDGISGICFTIGGDRGCRSIDDRLLDSRADQDTNEPAAVSLLAGDRWVYVRGLTPTGPTGPIEIESTTGPGEIVHGTITTEAGTFAVLRAPVGVNAFVLSVGPVGNRAIAEDRVVRPIR